LTFDDGGFSESDSLDESDGRTLDGGILDESESTGILNSGGNVLLLPFGCPFPVPPVFY
jgi:hypothetical protein